MQVFRYLKYSSANQGSKLRLNTSSWDTMASGSQFGGDGPQGQSRGFRGRGRGGRIRSYWRGRGTSDSHRGRSIDVRNEVSGEISPVQSKPQKVRPTHFLALPLHNHPALRSRVAAFQAALFGEDAQSNIGTSKISRNAIRTSPLVEGLDSSIVIDPVRIHMTLGVMALDDDAVANNNRGSAPSRVSKTVSTALALLASLSPKISQILDGEKGVKVPLEVLDVFKTERMRSRDPKQNGKEEDIGAGVLFLGPRESRRNAMDVERRKLMDVCELINQTFRDAGYLTDRQPLKLHCTILNASHRKPRGWSPFSYTDIRSNKKACDLLHSSELNASPNTISATSIQTPATPLPPMPVKLGTWAVDEVQLWVMGSRDAEGRYINCGGIKLGW